MIQSHIYMYANKIIYLQKKRLAIGKNCACTIASKINVTPKVFTYSFRSYTRF